MRKREFCRNCGQVEYCEEDSNTFFPDRIHWVFPKTDFEDEKLGVKCGEYIPYTWWNRLRFFLTTKLIRLICGENYGRAETR
jgi:hypothetical protein